MGFFDKLDDLTGSIKDAAGDVVEFIDDKVDMPVILGASSAFPHRRLSRRRRPAPASAPLTVRLPPPPPPRVPPPASPPADVKGMKEAGSAVYESSRETSDLCRETIDKAAEVVSFGMELKDTLDGLSADGTLDSDKFAVIQDLVDGDRIRAATALAGDLGGLALRCVDKSREWSVACWRLVGSAALWQQEH